MSKLARLKMAVAYERARRRLSESKRTGLRCPSCRNDVAEIESADPPVIVMRCPACGHHWQAEEPGTKTH